MKEWRILIENSVGYDWEFEKWRKEINQSVSLFGLDKWREKMDNKVTLKYFKEKIAPRKEIYYDGSYASELLFKARSLSLEVNNRTYRFSETKNKECLACLSGIDETVEHVVCECPAYGGERNNFKNNIIESVGSSTWSRECGDDEGMFKLMVGISGKATKHSVECTKIFLLNVWNKIKIFEARSNWEEESTVSAIDYDYERTMSVDELDEL